MNSSFKSKTYPKKIVIKESEKKKNWPKITVMSSVSPEAPSKFKNLC